jgi:hypothetical protein
MDEPSTTPYAIDPSDRLPALAEFLAELAGAASVDPDSAGEETISVSEIKVDLPIELNLLEELGRWQLDAAPPSQKIETTVMPVWHRVRLRVTVNNGERDLEPVES